MKIRIEVDETTLENEVVIRCAGLTKEVQMIQQALSEIAAGNQRFIFYKGETEYYMSLDEILFSKQKMAPSMFIQQMTSIRQNTNYMNWKNDYPVIL